MSSYRRKSQKSVGFYADENFVLIMEAHLKKKRMNKSQFIRDAIAEKMAKDGIEISDDLLLPLPPYSSPRKKVKISVAHNHGVIGDVSNVTIKTPASKSASRKS